jgi:hypothetical protein
LKKAAKLFAAKTLSETSPEGACRLEKHEFESPKSQNLHRQDIIKRKSLTNANETDNQQNERLNPHRKTQLLISALSANDVLVLCHRCKTHLSSKKRTGVHQIDAMTIQCYR